VPLVRVGRIGRPHGLAGELTLLECSLGPDELLGIGTFTWRGREGAARALTLDRVRGAGVRLLLGFAGLHNREQAAPLVNGELLAESERLPDPGPGVAYAFQLIGLAVVTEDGRELGTLAEVMGRGAQPLYVVRGARELMIPAVPEFIKRVDLEARRVTVSLPAGLEEL